MTEQQTAEQWALVPGIPPFEASTIGRIRMNGEIVVPSLNKFGYLTIAADDREHGVHYLVARAWCGFIPRGYHVHHINGNKTDNRASNLQVLQPDERMEKHSRQSRVKHIDNDTIEYAGEKWIKQARRLDDAEHRALVTLLNMAGTPFDLDGLACATFISDVSYLISALIPLVDRGLIHYIALDHTEPGELKEMFVCPTAEQWLY